MTEEMLARKLGEGESQKLEFKESFGSECIETACAFANANVIDGRVLKNSEKQPT